MGKAALGNAGMREESLGRTVRSVLAAHAVSTALLANQSFALPSMGPRVSGGDTLARPSTALKQRYRDV